MRIKRSSHITSKGFFRYAEFYRSAKYPALALSAPLDQAIVESIFFWVESCGDPFRQAHPKTRLCTLSGVRTYELNKKINGSDYSDHLPDHYCAVDLHSPDMKPTSLFLEILEMQLPFRQLILYQRKKFIHWSWNIPGKPYKTEAKII